ncbi:MAG: 30S ribosomal protein S4 [Candidatus Uhrbacteria bacterium]
MARNLGPKHRMCRRVGEKLCDLDRCPITRREYPPGAHGATAKRRKVTEYGAQLLEKQKAKVVYGILERQLRGYYERALRSQGDTGVILSRFLECRLDNVVFRMGFTKSRAAARQAVTHGHVMVNARRVSIPSYQVRVGDVVALRERSRTSPLFVDYPRLAAERIVPVWLTIVPDDFRGQVIRLPEPADIKNPFRIRGIVEFYSR